MQIPRGRLVLHVEAPQSKAVEGREAEHRGGGITGFTGQVVADTHINQTLSIKPSTGNTVKL